ncbi:hypothetical protein QYE76_055294 [Lolium multiflorum]|uniref:Integrase catalytic domain-containing protein n=1 Tax=Lolium multiflorum TaxID=4521 RepID=A0AAD8WPB8_LOLMU|nr:hypothetical protein QYE76_055294 [Lolium multiflorum]
MAIRSDNGSEFKNYTLNDFLSDEGIRHQYSAAYTPQQNGVAERKNRTLMDMARSMMAEYKSRYNFWAEAISTACHSSNRLYLRKGLNKTPYEILTGNKPNISYFKVFGCKCFYKIKGVRLSKFAPKALEGIFVGYGAESHTYRIFDIASGIIIESCSVRFEENDGSQVGQVDVCAGDEIPQDAIVRMGVGFSAPLRDTVWRLGKNYALPRWSPHLLNINKPYLVKQMMHQPKNKNKTLPLMCKIKDKIKVKINQSFIMAPMRIQSTLALLRTLFKIKHMRLSNPKQLRKLKFKVKTGTQMIKLIK